MTEEVFPIRICQYLKENFNDLVLSATELADKEYYFMESQLF